MTRGTKAASAPVHAAGTDRVRLVPGLRARPRSRSVDAASLGSVVLTRALTRRALLLVGAAFASGCAAAPAPVASAQVRFLLEPASARVYTDERFLGAARVVATRPVQLRAGPRRFTIVADGYFPHDLETDLAPGLTTIRVSLRPVPP